MNVPLILIVDDTPLNVELLESLLRSEGFQTISAEDGPTCRHLCRSAAPDMVLLDVVMPGESGFETCAKLKSDSSTADIPIIFLSALDNVKDKVRGLKAGGVDFVSKPVHGEEVLARVRVHLRISENNRRIAREQQAQLEEFRHAQQSILTRPEDLKEACFEVFYEPLQGAGGDFYDVLAVNQDLYGYFVADVSGHGVSAAFLTAAIKALLRQYTGPLYPIEDTMRGVDSVMRQMLGEEQYLTACYVQLNRDTRRLSVISAGHPPLILVSASGEARTVVTDSDPLGIFSSLVLQRKDLNLSKGDRLFLYTDGMTEAEPGAPRQVGLDALIEACVATRLQPLRDAVSTIITDFKAQQTSAADDLLLLGVEVG